jgi:hypothetical protein
MKLNRSIVVRAALLISLMATRRLNPAFGVFLSSERQQDDRNIFEEETR